MKLKVCRGPRLKMWHLMNKGTDQIAPSAEFLCPVVGVLEGDVESTYSLVRYDGIRYAVISGAVIKPVERCEAERVYQETLKNEELKNAY